MYPSIIHHPWRDRVALLVTLLALTWVPGLAHSGKTHTVEISEDSFSPDFLEIVAGDSIEFVNTGELDRWPASNVHPTHELYSDFDARRPILPGQSWTFTFFETGLWGFHDHSNPQNVGQVMVLPDAHQGSAVQSAGTEEEVGGTGLVRIYNAARMFITRIFEAAKLFAAEAFPRSVASVDPARASAPETELNTKFRPPPDVEFENVYQEAEINCAPDDFDCFEEYFRQQVIASGPEITVELVNRLREDGVVSTIVDEHQLAHRIGRQTAETYGVNEQAFLLRPMESLNGGRQHGFFEYVLARTDSSSEAADLICKSLGEGYSFKFQFYCYHGVGHGVMMAAAYDLSRALDSCDTFSTFMAQDGCWQGVFMENVNGYMTGAVREGTFSDVDPLAPCNTLEEKYQHECYINHAGYLMHFFDDDVSLAASSCLHAADGYTDMCLQSIGLMATNPVWQVNFVQVEGRAFVDIAWEICLMFPDGQLDQCVIGAIDNIHNFDYLDLSRAMAFCDTVDSKYGELCYGRMGFNLSNQVVDLSDVRDYCGLLSDEFVSFCLMGAGIGVES